MTTVLIEEYAVLRVAIQHALEMARSPESIVAITPQTLKDTSSLPGRPIELLVIGATGDTAADLRVLSTSLSLLAPRHTLVLYETLDQRLLLESARAGVGGMLPKSSLPAAIAAAAHLLLAGGQCFPRVVLGADLPPQEPHAPGHRPHNIRKLTARQKQILRLLARGHTMREISHEIGISVATVKSHARTLYWKLNARNQAEASYIAMQEGLLQGDDDGDTDVH